MIIVQRTPPISSTSWKQFSACLIPQKCYHKLPLAWVVRKYPELILLAVFSSPLSKSMLLNRLAGVPCKCVPQRVWSLMASRFRSLVGLVPTSVLMFFVLSFALALLGSPAEVSRKEAGKLKRHTANCKSG